MFRQFISGFVALGLLMQTGMTLAQPQLSPHEPVSAESAMPCHGSEGEAAPLKQAGAASCCNSGDCSCALACGASTLPASAAELDALIAEHFQALRTQSAEVPAHNLPPLRPPAIPHS